MCAHIDDPSRRDSQSPPPSTKFSKNPPPQQTINKFWKKFTTKTSGKPFTILPDNSHAKRIPPQAPLEAEIARKATVSYEQAVKACKARDIFDKPQFYIEGMTSSDVRQGREGDCWFMSATKNIGKLCRQAQMLYTLRNAKTQMRHSSLFCKKRIPRLIVITARSKEAGEGLEDLTGGVTSELFTADILDKDKFWMDELMNVNKLFLFGLTQMSGLQEENKGIVKKHAYSIMEVRELDDFRLLKINADVPWSVKHLNTYFRIKLSKASPVVIMICQLDDRYFQGLAGQYKYQLHFQLHKDGQEEYVAQNKPSYFMHRSVTAEPDLEAGQYTVMVKITASRDTSEYKPEEVIVANCETRPEKLMAVGRRYDLAHAKGDIHASGIERRERLRQQKRDKRKWKAKKEFEMQRLADKKEKLKRLRKEAKGKAKAPKDAKDDAKDTDEIMDSIKKDGSTIQHREQLGTNKTVCGARSMLHEGNGTHLKIYIEDSNTSEVAKQGDKASQNEQRTEAEDKKGESGKQWQQGTKNQGENKEQKESENEKPEGQPNTPTDNDTDGSKENPNAKTTTITDNATKPSKAAKSTTSHLPKLTLDDISDDGLSWSSDVDALPNSDTSDSSDSDSDSIRIKPARSSSKETPDKASDAKPADEAVKDPWNAICTFGLRVYAKGTQAEIEVVNGGDEEGSGGNEKGIKAEQKEGTKENLKSEGSEV
ncbi:MAG: hypothetical protein Q9166_002571 [cf. Caloplaca sp. 2 TL-2023]